jgi:hypothetical protein
MQSEYMAERDMVESTLSDDDRQFDVDYLSYADGCDTLAELYNPHEFDPETLTRYLTWLQRQVAAVKELFSHSASSEPGQPLDHDVGSSDTFDDEYIPGNYQSNFESEKCKHASHHQLAVVQEEAFWNHAFLLHYNVRAMYNAWEVTLKATETKM